MFKLTSVQAACSLTIGVGSFSDPPEVPGLAHFLEHMVFMGSKKYPQVMPQSNHSIVSLNVIFLYLIFSNSSL